MNSSSIDKLFTATKSEKNWQVIKRITWKKSEIKHQIYHEKKSGLGIEKKKKHDA